MKVTYQIFKIIDKEVCVPSTDHYARNGDWGGEHIKTLHLIKEEDSLEEAVAYLEKTKEEKTKEEQYDWGKPNKTYDYTILPVYTF